MAETISSGRVRDKVALISRGASGIGRAAALLLAREGARVAVADINKAGAQRTSTARQLLVAGALTA